MGRGKKGGCVLMREIGAGIFDEAVVALQQCLPCESAAMPDSVDNPGRFGSIAFLMSPVSETQKEEDGMMDSFLI